VTCFGRWALLAMLRHLTMLADECLQLLLLVGRHAL
jgi:hypothetical protein